MPKKEFYEKSGFKIGIGLVAIVLLAIVFWPRASTLLPGTTTPTAATSYDLSFAYYNNGTAIDSDDVTAAWYYVDSSDMSTAEIEDLAFADFTADDTDSKAFTPDADRIYVVKVTATGFDTKYLTTNNLVGTSVLDAMEQIVLGDNEIDLMHSCSDVVMLAYSKTEYSSTVASTDYRDWVVMVNTLDGAEGTGEATSKEGYLGSVDFENGHNENFVIRATFNTTALVSWCEFKSAYVCEEVASTTYIYYEISAALLGSSSFELRLGSAIGDTFEAASIQIGHGCATSFTQWDTQS